MEWQWNVRGKRLVGSKSGTSIYLLSVEEFWISYIFFENQITEFLKKIELQFEKKMKSSVVICGFKISINLSA